MTHIDTDTDLHKRTHTVDIDAYKCLHSDWVSSRESQPLVFPGQFRNKKIPFKKWHSISELHPNCWNMILMITKFTKSFYELQKKTHLLHPACLNFTTHLIGSKKKRTRCVTWEVFWLLAMDRRRPLVTWTLPEKKRKRLPAWSSCLGVGEAQGFERNYGNIWISTMYENSHLWYMFGMSMADSMDETY